MSQGRFVPVWDDFVNSFLTNAVATCACAHGSNEGQNLRYNKHFASSYKENLSYSSNRHPKQPTPFFGLKCIRQVEVSFILSQATVIFRANLICTITHNTNYRHSWVEIIYYCILLLLKLILVVNLTVLGSMITDWEQFQFSPLASHLTIPKSW